MQKDCHAAEVLPRLLRLSTATLEATLKRQRATCQSLSATAALGANATTPPSVR